MLLSTHPNKHPRRVRLIGSESFFETEPRPWALSTAIEMEIFTDFVSRTRTMEAILFVRSGEFDLARQDGTRSCEETERGRACFVCGGQTPDTVDR